MLKERWKTICLFVYLTDLSALAGAWWIVWSFMGIRPREQWAYIFALTVITFLLWSALFYAFSLYEPFRVQSIWVTVWKVVKISFVGSALLILMLGIVEDHAVALKIAAVYGAVSFILLACLKVVIRLLAAQVRRHGYDQRNVVIVGVSEHAQRVVEAIRAHASWGLRLIGCIITDKTVRPVAGLPEPMGTIEDLETILVSEVVDEVIFAVSVSELHRLENLFLICEELGITTKIVLSVFPHVNAKPHFEELPDTPLLSFTTVPRNELALVLKRIIDVVGSAIFLLALLPAIVVVAVMIKASSPGPVLFKQVRVGRNGRAFVLYKFRSMYINAELMKKNIAELNELSGPVFKLGDDPRVTKVGKWLRRTSFDELPQLINVLKGDMSLVGPRPPLPEEVNQYQRWQRRRLSVKPGLTGLWQVSGRNYVRDFNERVRLDLAYIDNWSLLLDLRILLKTIPEVLLGRGAS